MINLFHIPNHVVNTSNWTHSLHDKGVEEFEQKIADYVGAKYACGVNSATNAITLILNKEPQSTGPFLESVNVPSIIPPVVCNAICASMRRGVRFYDDIDWVGDSYVLHRFPNYKIIDSAQKLERDQFKKEANDEDVMFFSFYPTKPVGSLDGGMIVTNDKEKHEWYKTMVMNGMSYAHDNWNREIIRPGYKMYLSSVQADIANRNFEVYEDKLERLKMVRDAYNSILHLDNTSNHLYRVEVEDNKKTQATLKDEGISTGIHYAALHELGVYTSGKEDLKKSSEHAKHTLSLPFHERLSFDDVDKIIRAIRPHLKTIS